MKLVKAVFRRKCNRRNGERSDEAGDTLVELLIAMTIIAITVAGLLGGLATDIGSSGTHRGIATLDGILQSFAEEARQVIELDPNGAQFTPCSSTPPAYRMVSAPYPSYGSPNTAVTVFATGFTLGVGVSTVLLEPNPGSTTGATQVYPAAPPPLPLQAAPAPATPTATFGNTTITFLVPTGLTPGTSYYVAVTQTVVVSGRPKSLTAVSSVPFTPVSASTANPVDPSPMQNYTLGITAVSYWNGSDFTATSCNPANALNADLQQVTIRGTAPGVSDTYNVVVTSPIAFKGGAAIPITYSGPASPQLGDTLTYTADVSNASGYSSFASPTGTLTWYVIPPSGPAASCSTIAPSSPTWTLPSGTTPTCSFKAMAAGTYSVYARYTGDQNYLSTLGQCPPTTTSCNPAAIPRANPTLSVVGTSNNAAYHPTITFTATVSGPGNTPTGTINWNISQTGNSFATTPSCGGATLNSSGQATCTIANATPGSYIATATYDPTTPPPGDPNYNPAGPSSSNTVNVPFLSQTVTLTETVSGATVTVHADVTGPAGDPPPTGSVSWTKKYCSTNTISLDSSGVHATCAFTASTPNSGYFGMFTYNGDVNYSPSTTPVNIPIAKAGYASGPGTFALTLTITGPLGGPSPGGNVTWTNVTAGGVPTSCISQTSSSSGNVTTFSCALPPVPVSYQASASYSGDPNYLPPYPNPTTVGPVTG